VGMKRLSSNYILPGTVYDAAVKRIAWCFDEFDGQVCVGISGGKDSTVTVELALAEATRRGLLPLKVWWLDQECEYQGTVDYVRELRERPGIDLDWYQIPFRLSNATNHAEEFQHVWAVDKPWVREKEPGTIHENDLGVDRFHSLLHAISDRYGGVTLAGVRSEESPSRRIGITSGLTYKWVTWGHRKAKTAITLYPIYDWSYRDVWKAIDDGDGERSWAYNRIYDLQHRYGLEHLKMRVSNYHHETSLQALAWLQEAEPATWDAAVSRVVGINTAGHLGTDFYVQQLPYMFASWREYHAYLVENLVPDAKGRAIFHRQLARAVSVLDYMDPERIAKTCVMAVLANDLSGTKAENFMTTFRMSVEQREELARKAAS
jgi:predicted phosphoadenosine phosphosulfate sulfurtransferase